MLETHAPDAGDRASIARPQPWPRDTQVLYIPEIKKTVIARAWNPGDPARCRRCPAGRCIARPGQLCTFLVPGKVAQAEAEGYSTQGLRWPEPSRRRDGIMSLRRVR